MKRRDFLAGTVVGAGIATTVPVLLNSVKTAKAPVTVTAVKVPDLNGEMSPASKVDAPTDIDHMALEQQKKAVDQAEIIEQSINDTELVISQPEKLSQQDKVRFFDRNYGEDVILEPETVPLAQATLKRIKQVERLVGHGNFNILTFDDALKFAKRYEQVGAFTPAELEFIERIFFADATEYGFMGNKVVSDLTARINKRDTFKVPHSGHYLFNGESRAYYDKLVGDLGSSVILTSGIRSNMKQLQLFLSKCVATDFNLSRASRSLAPPGHSYHGIGDFDVGKVGWGLANFSSKFAQTDEFKRMQDLGYVQIRYTEDNRLGVRFEPWHIKVV